MYVYAIIFTFITNADASVMDANIILCIELKKVR